MANYVLTNEAIRDLRNIWNYTFETWSERQADIYYSMLIKHFQLIANNPSLGKNYNNISPHLFVLKAKRHIIFYRRPINESIQIIRILHQRMDLKKRVNN